MHDEDAAGGEVFGLDDTQSVLIFAGFVILTLGITYWAAQRTRTAKDFYAARGGVTGITKDQNASGDLGVYDLIANTITLTGNVVVSHSKVKM